MAAVWQKGGVDNHRKMFSFNTIPLERIVRRLMFEGCECEQLLHLQK